MVWEGITERPAAIVDCDLALLDDWRLVRTSSDSIQCNSSRPITVSWSKPPKRFIKCNIDAFFSVQLSMVGIGLCLCIEFGLSWKLE